MGNLSELVGIPYLINGSTEQGCDCWGLVQLYYIKYKNIQLPNFAGVYKNPQIVADIEEKQLVTGDIILLREFGDSLHCGLFVHRDIMLNSQAPQGSHLARITSPKWHGRVLAYLRVNHGI